MNLSFRHIFLGLALAATVGSAWSLDLPIKRINGKDYYYYAVQRNDNIIEVAKKLGVTRDEIISDNPAASEPLKSGMTLYFPVSRYSETNQNLAGVSAGSSNLRYKVQSGETLFGIAYKFGVTPDEIAALNPQANAGVRAGQIILIPSKEGASDVAPAATVATAAPSSEKAEAALNPVEEQAAAQQPATAQSPSNSEASPQGYLSDQPVPEEYRTVTQITDLAPLPLNPAMSPVESDEEIAKSTIALLLPLMLNQEQQDKHAKSATDFVRGFMLGLESMSEDSTPLDVKVYDSRESASEISAILSRPELKDVDLVIAPDDAVSRAAVLNGLKGNDDAFILNLFSAVDTSYITNPQVIQTYIPAALMYEKAAETILEEYPDHQPVFIWAKGGRDEKKPFTDYLREQYAVAGVEPIDIGFEGALSMDDLVDLDYTAKYIFIPASGSLNEFNKFYKTVTTFRGDVADKSSVVLFGYPDWTAFKSDAAEGLHKVEAVVYSRFYNDSTDPATQALYQAFSKAYGSKPLEAIPSQALLGYDAARYLITNISTNDGVFTPEEQQPFKGLQSTFMFATADEESQEDDVRTTGPVNQALYIVKFLPEDQVSVQVL